jgi:hypothetical protein
MAITAVYTTGATNGGTGSSYTLTPPNSTAQVGDVAVVVVAERTNVEAVTNVADTAAGTLTFTKLRFGAQSSAVSTGIWYRVLQSGDPGVGNVNTWTVTTTAAGEGALAVYRGVDSGTPIDAQGTTNTTSSSSATFNAVTTLTSGAMFVGGLGQNCTAAPLSAQSSGSPTLTNRANNWNGGNTSTRCGAGIVDGIITSAGSSGAFVWTLNNSLQWATDSFALRPAATFIARQPVVVGQSVKRAAYF